MVFYQRFYFVQVLFVKRRNGYASGFVQVVFYLRRAVWVFHSGKLFCFGQQLGFVFIVEAGRVLGQLAIQQHAAVVNKLVYYV